MALGFTPILMHTLRIFSIFPDLPATQENVDGQHNLHVTAQKTDVPQGGHLFATAGKHWRWPLSWLLPDPVLSSPRVETQPQSRGSGSGCRVQSPALPYLTFTTP